MKRSWYSRLSDEDRDLYIRKVSLAKRKRVATSSSSCTNDGTTTQKMKQTRLFRAKSLSYYVRGHIMFRPVDTRTHVLPNPTFCQYCQATKFNYEAPSFCCSNGTVKLASTKIPPMLSSRLKTLSIQKYSTSPPGAQPHIWTTVQLLLYNILTSTRVCLPNMLHMPHSISVVSPPFAVNVVDEADLDLRRDGFHDLFNCFKALMFGSPIGASTVENRR